MAYLVNCGDSNEPKNINAKCNKNCEHNEDGRCVSNKKCDVKGKSLFLAFDENDGGIDIDQEVYVIPSLWRGTYYQQNESNHRAHIMFNNSGGLSNIAEGKFYNIYGLYCAIRTTIKGDGKSMFNAFAQIGYPCYNYEDINTISLCKCEESLYNDIRKKCKELLPDDNHNHNLSIAYFVDRIYDYFEGSYEDIEQYVIDLYYAWFKDPLPEDEIKRSCKSFYDMEVEKPERKRGVPSLYDDYKSDLWSEVYLADGNRLVFKDGSLACFENGREYLTYLKNTCNKEVFEKRMSEIPPYSESDEDWSPYDPSKFDKPYLIDGLIQEGSYGMLFAYAGGGKTTTAVMLADILLTQEKFLGQKINRHPDVTIVSWESAQKTYYLTQEINKNITLIPRERRINVNEINGVISKFSNQLLILDNFGEFSPFDNQTDDKFKLLEYCSKLAKACKEHNVTVIVLAHSPKNQIINRGFSLANLGGWAEMSSRLDFAIEVKRFENNWCCQFVKCRDSTIDFIDRTFSIENNSFSGDTINQTEIDVQWFIKQVNDNGYKYLNPVDYGTRGKEVKEKLITQLDYVKWNKNVFFISDTYKPLFSDVHQYKYEDLRGDNDQMKVDIKYYEKKGLLKVNTRKGRLDFL